MTDFTTWDRKTLERLAEDLTGRMIEDTAEKIRLNSEIKRLKAELAQAKLYMPAQRAKPMPKTERGPCNLAAWGILAETDEEFAERAGAQAAEVVE